MNIDIPRLRQFWSVIETTQPSILVTLDDTSLVECLMEKLQEQHLLDHQETDRISHYIRSKVLLIRELAEAKL